MGIGFVGQHGLGIGAGAMVVVAELDPAKFSLGSLLPLLGRAEFLSPARWMVVLADPPCHRCAPGRRGWPRPEARSHPPSIALRS